MGLVRGMARTAVIAGTATHVSNNVSRRQAQRWAGDQAAQQPAPAPAAESELSVQLQELAALQSQGVITQEEFEAKKKQLLGI